MRLLYSNSGEVRANPSWRQWSYLSAALAWVLLARSMAFAAVVPPGAATDSPFHFTVASDLHCQTNNYSIVLDAMRDHSGGQGAFQVSVGDVTDKSGQTPAGIRQLIDSRFGPQAIWYPAVGNHDIRGRKKSTSMQWRREEFANGNGTRKPLKDLVDRAGPKGSMETTYSWDCGNAHLVVLNEYWSGKVAAGSDTATGGEIVPALLAWLEDDLCATQKPFIFVFGHEPAFAEQRHIGNSLDARPKQRNVFWNLLQKYHVQAFISGHVHFYYKELHGSVYQINDGNAGNGSAEKHQTYLDVTVGSKEASVQVWQNEKNGSSRWRLAESIFLQPTR